MKLTNYFLVILIFDDFFNDNAWCLKTRGFLFPFSADYRMHLVSSRLKYSQRDDFADGEQRDSHFWGRGIPQVPFSLKDIANEASRACLEMIEEQNVHRVQVEIKGSGALDERQAQFDLTVGHFIRDLVHYGFHQVRIIFRSFEQAVATRPYFPQFSRSTNLIVDVLETASIAEEDELVVFIQPSNFEHWDHLERVQCLVAEATVGRIPSILVNPRLQNYMKRPPLLLADFQHAFFYDRMYYQVNPYITCAVLKRYPRKWEMFVIDVPRKGYVYLKEFSEQPNHVQIAKAFRLIQKEQLEFRNNQNTS